MKRLVLLNVLILFVAFSSYSQEEEPAGSQVIVIETAMGNIEILLYDDTPLHRDNMIKLIKEGYFDGQLFHRVINNFMIQGGDPHSKNSAKGQRLGTGGPGYRIDAEFRPNHFHKKGALAAARMGDNVNPQKQSSGSQFYIVQGQVYSLENLLQLQERKMHAPFTPEEIEVYTTIGGTPFLDGSYTVFGEVIKGIDVVDKIAAVATDSQDRPIEDVVYSIHLK